MKIGKSVITPRWGDILIYKYKSFEYQFEGPNFMKDGEPFECDFAWTHKRDHAGISFTFGIAGLFWMNLNIHDRRHWDIKNNTWQSYDAS